MRFRPTDHPRAARSRVVHLIPMLAPLTLVALIALPGCGGKKVTKPPVPTTAFTGIATGSTFSGMLTVNIPTSAVTAPSAFGAQAGFTATGTFAPLSGPSIALAGEYDDVSNFYSLYGRDTGGAVWAFYGTETTFGFRGLADADTSDGSAEGFNAVFRGSTDITVILGTSNSTALDDLRNFNFAFNATELHGFAVATDTTEAVTLLDGTISAGTIAIVQAADTGFPPAHTPTPATGTYDSGTGAASGTYDDLVGHTGTWSGARHP